MLAKHWVKLAIMIVTGLLIVVLSCSEDPVEPVVVDIGGTLSVMHISQAEGEAIVIDGIADAAWNDAKEFRVVVSDSLGNIELMRLKGLTDSTYLYLLVQWDDPTREVMPDRWIFPDESGRHESGGGQDFLVMMFDDGDNVDFTADCTEMCHATEEDPFYMMRNDGPAMVDAWMWSAGQTDPVRTLDDVHFDASDSVAKDLDIQEDPPIYERNRDVIIAVDSITGEVDTTYEVMWMHEDSVFYTGEFLYVSESQEWRQGFIDPDTNFIQWPEGATIPGYLLADSVTHFEGESRWEIEAKGNHDAAAGYWLVEIKRKLNTGFDDDDVQFILGEKVSATVGFSGPPPSFNSPHPHTFSELFDIQF